MGIPERKGGANAAERPALRQAQRERILEAARRIVTRDGLAALSMRKIASAIGYSPASLYLYFENRDEIAYALGVEGRAALLAELAPHAQIADPRERLRALAHAYVAFGFAYPQTYRVMFLDHFMDVSAPAGSAEQGDPAVLLFADALAALDDAYDAPLVEALWATLHGIVALSLARAGAMRTPPGQLVDTALDTWLRARNERPHAEKKTQATAP
jgi:AcrR family transcriptional regulator